MKKKYVIGVDGGNSKTDYFLFDTEGNFVDHIKDGTCSHERFADAYESSYRIMNDNIKSLLSRNGLTIDDAAAGAFGLAGADVPIQKEKLTEVVEKIGFTNYAVDNDSFLGIKAGSENGYGVCSINGSGTVAGGISPSGKRLQIGGIGQISGDEAGGFFLSRGVIRGVYDSLYRLGKETDMTKPVMELLGVKDKLYFIQNVSDYLSKGTLPTKELIQILFRAVDNQDHVAFDIVDNTSLQLAKSTAGCINNLDFGNNVDIILAGSVWIKAETPILFKQYRKYIEEFTEKKCKYIFLQVPPAAGAVLWALELFNNEPVDKSIRKKVIDVLSPEVVLAQVREDQKDHSLTSSLRAIPASEN